MGRKGGKERRVGRSQAGGKGEQVGGGGVPGCPRGSGMGGRAAHELLLLLFLPTLADYKKLL